MKKPLKKKEGKLKVGDRVWLRIPHNGRIEFIYKNGDLRIELDEIPAGTLMARFSPQEVMKIEKSAPTRK